MAGWLDEGIQKALESDPQCSEMQSHRDESRSVKATLPNPVSTKLKLCPETEDVQG